MSAPNDHGQQNGIPQPPAGVAFRVDRVTVTSSTPMPPVNPGVPPMVPSPGFGFLPPSFVGGQQFPTPAPVPGFGFIPPPLLVNLQAPLGLAPQGLLFAFGGFQRLGMPMGLGIPPVQGIPQGGGVPLPPTQLPVFNMVPNAATTTFTPVVKKKKKRTEG